MDDANPWLLAARSVIREGPFAPDRFDSPAHLRQHPACAIPGKTEQVFTRCCGTLVPLPRPMWPCEIPSGTGLSRDCCERPFALYGDAEPPERLSP